MSAFPPAQRRKRVTTYGKPARAAPYDLHNSPTFLETANDASPVKKKNTLTSVRANNKLRKPVQQLRSPVAQTTEDTEQEKDIWDFSSDAHESDKSKKAHVGKLNTLVRPTKSARPKPEVTRSPSTERELTSDASNDSRKRKRTNLDGVAQSASIAQKVIFSNSADPIAPVSVPFRSARRKEGVNGIAHKPAQPAASRSVTLMPSAIQKKRRGNDSVSIVPAIAISNASKPLAHALLEPASLPAPPRPVSRSGPKSPHKTPPRSSVLPSTPPYSSPEGPRTARKINTPKQNLLQQSRDERALVQSPSNLPITTLSIASPAPKQALQQSLVTSGASQPAARRVRLIDSLNQGQPRRSPTVDGESSDDDVEMEDSDGGGRAVDDERFERAFRNLAGGDSEEIGSQSLQGSQSQSQSQTLTATGPKITYARDRSYLTEEQLGGDLSFDTPFDIPTESTTRRALDPFASSQKILAQDEEDDEDTAGGLRTIHELRAAGGNRRFIDDFENILEDLSIKSTGSMSRQRGAMVEFCINLQDDTYFRKVSDHGFQERILERCSNITDPILCFLAPVAVALMFQSGASAAAAQQLVNFGYLKTFIAALKLGNDIERVMRERRSNMSKVAQKTLSDLRAEVEQTIWSVKPKVVSPRAVALTSFELLIKKLRESGHADAVLDRELITTIAELTRESDDLAMIEASLSILEWESLAFSASKLSCSWPSGSINVLADTLPARLCSEEEATDNIEFVSIRLLLNLTNRNQKNCTVFSQSGTILALLGSIASKFRRMDPVPDESTVNRLVLALGALINLAEFSDAARLAALANGDDLLNEIVAIFLANSKNAAMADSVEESLRNVATGYLAIAIGNLCENLRVRRIVRAKLLTSDSSGLALLVKAVEEFILYHQNVDKIRTQAEDVSELGGQDTSVWANHTERMQCVVQRLKMYKD